MSMPRGTKTGQSREEPKQRLMVHCYRPFWTFKHNTIGGTMAQKPLTSVEAVSSSPALTTCSSTRKVVSFLSAVPGYLPSDYGDDKF